MALNKHVNESEQRRCFFCGKVLEKEEHGVHFRGTKSDGSGYESIYLHALCAIEFQIILHKDLRFSVYTEKYKLSLVPRTIETTHLRIDQWDSKR